MNTGCLAPVIQAGGRRARGRLRRREQQARPKAAPPLPSPRLLVLHASDLGPGYLPQAGATKPITLAHKLLHESAPARVGIVGEAMTSRDVLARTQDARLTAAS